MKRAYLSKTRFPTSELNNCHLFCAYLGFEKKYKIGRLKYFGASIILFTAITVE